MQFLLYAFTTDPYITHLLYVFSYSVSGFAVSLAQIEVGIAYACWAALGTAIVSTSGILLFGESYDSVKLLCLLMIMAGVVGLNLRAG
jgi:small multidrug resistance pump